jgi:predicted phosphodiesterase
MDQDLPLLAFGGPYSNLEATLAVLQEAKRLGIPDHRIVCTGDIVAYGADPLATVELIRLSGIQVVMGNCEESLGFEAGDCGCGFVEGSECDRLSAAWYAHASRELDSGSCAWMRSLPRSIEISLGRRRVKAVHGSPSAINRFIFASTPQAAKAQEIDFAGCDGIIAGHCGLPFTQIIADRLWHNPGAVGMPANDGTPRVWFSVLTPQSNGVRIEHRSLDYDYQTAAVKIRRAKLPEPYARALATGRWPSCEILPKEELAASGKPIEPEKTLWSSLTSVLARSKEVANAK